MNYLGTRQRAIEHTDLVDVTIEDARIAESHVPADICRDIEGLRRLARKLGRELQGAIGPHIDGAFGRLDDNGYKHPLVIWNVQAGVCLCLATRIFVVKFPTAGRFGDECLCAAIRST